MSGAGDFLALLAVAAAAMVVGRRAIARLRALRGTGRRAIPIARAGGAAECRSCERCGGCGKGATPH